MSFAPGPWKVHPVEWNTATGWKDSLTVLDANDTAIMVIPPEMDEIASLIAAAPELLDLAKDGLELAEEMLEGPYETSSLREIVARFREGIAKAEGRERGGY